MKTFTLSPILEPRGFIAVAMLVIVAGFNSCAETTKADVITLSPVPDTYGVNQQRVLYFNNGSSLSFAN